MAQQSQNEFTCINLLKPEFTTEEILALKRLVSSIQGPKTFANTYVWDTWKKAEAVEAAECAVVLPNFKKEKIERKLQFEFNNHNKPIDIKHQNHYDPIEKPSIPHIEIRTLTGTIAYFVGTNIFKMKFNDFRGFVIMGMQIPARQLRLIFKGKQFESQIDRTLEELDITESDNLIHLVMRLC